MKELSQKEKKDLVNLVGNQLAAHLAGFHGKVQFNIHDGVYVNASVEESVKPEKRQK